jgi:predicted nucleic acid-binding protein
MRRFFADTSYWIAFLNPRDDLHGRAREIRRTLNGTIVLTSEMVLSELLNDFAGRGPRLRVLASGAVEVLRKDPNIQIIPQSTTEFSRALVRYQTRPDKSWSLTDCSSFLIMESEGIEAALTYDRHFEQAGFQALLR